MVRSGRGGAVGFPFSKGDAVPWVSLGFVLSSGVTSVPNRQCSGMLGCEQRGGLYYTGRAREAHLSCACNNWETVAGRTSLLVGEEPSGGRTERCFFSA